MLAYIVRKGWPPFFSSFVIVLRREVDVLDWVQLTEEDVKHLTTQSSNHALPTRQVLR